MTDPSGAKKVKADVFANSALATVTIAVADTLTFQQINMAVGLFQGVAMNLHKIEWWPSMAACRQIVAASDNLHMALTTTNRLTTIQDITDPAIVAMKAVVGIGVAVERYELPLIQSFEDLPSGGRLIPAQPLFLAADTSGFSAGVTINAVLYFTFHTLADADYLELLQSIYPVNL